MLNLTMKEMDRLKDFLQWNDPNGVYTDENCIIEDIPIMDNEETLIFVIEVLEFEELDNANLDIQEMKYKEVEEFLKSKGLYETTLEKINILKENDKNVTLWKEII